MSNYLDHCTIWCKSTTDGLSDSECSKISGLVVAPCGPARRGECHPQENGYLNPVVSREFGDQWMVAPPHGWGGWKPGLISLAVDNSVDDLTVLSLTL